MAREILRGPAEPAVGQDVSNFSLGYNGYTSEHLLSPTMWKFASNIYSGQFAKARRARFANVVIDGTSAGTSIQNGRYVSAYSFRDPTPQNVLLGDINGTPPTQWAFNIASLYAGTQRINPMNPDQSMGSLAGPWARCTILNQVFECNGFVKQRGRGTLCTTIESWGLDTPDASPTVTLAGGAITKTTGRSYRFAWENANTTDVSAPSPATAYIAYAAQQGTIDCLEVGTLNALVAGTAVVGAGTAFTSAWIGRRLWIQGVGGSSSTRIVTVTDATHLTVAANITIGAGSKFTVFDPAATHLRLYATGDGAAQYLRIQRNVFVQTDGTLAGSGVEFVDNSNAEPPNAPFTTELAQFFNVPPPVAGFVMDKDYQSRLIIYRVPGFLQSLFYSNIELTTIGQPPSCFAPLNQITLPIGDATINGSAALPTGLVVWSDKHDMFKITGQLTDNSLTGPLQLSSTLQRLPYDLGCASPRAAVVTPLGVIWLTTDYEIRMYNDVHATRNIGRPVQDILNSINAAKLSNARATYYHRKDKNWVAFTIATGSNTSNNKMLLLDIDLLSANGSPSFFLFDMATNQPGWYVFDISSDCAISVFDSGAVSAAVGQHRLLIGTVDAFQDADYDGAAFKQGVELPVANNLTLHAVGNDTATQIKEVEWARFVTGTDPGLLQQFGWSFGVDMIDDDKYTFPNPLTRNLLPNVTSPNASTPQGVIYQRQYEFSPGLFEFKGIRYVRARRYRFKVNFPTVPPPNDSGGNPTFWDLSTIMYKDHSVVER